MRLISDGEKGGMEVGEEGDYIYVRSNDSFNFPLG